MWLNLPSILKRTRTFLLLATCTLVLPGCMPKMHEFEMPALDTEAREAAILAQSSNGDLLDKGRALFQANRFAAAARRLEALHKRTPQNAEVIVRLGLALWFSGRPAQAEALWNNFSSPDDPDLENQLKDRASALRILSYRLGARRILEDHRRGELMPAVPGSVVILPAQPSRQQNQTHPDITAGLHFLLLQFFSHEHPLQAAPRELVNALRAESGAGLSATLVETLSMARILGADHAVTISTFIPDGQPHTLRTTFTAQVTEALQTRSKRLATERRRAETAWATAESQLRHLEDQQERCAEILTYFNTTHRLSSLVARRDQLADTATRLNREGNVPQATKAMQRHREIVDEMAQLQIQIKDYERRLVLGMEGVRRFTPKAFRERSEQLDQQQQHLKSLLPELRKAAWTAVARASTSWPIQGRTTSFDTPLASINTWPAQAVKQLARLLSEPAVQPPATREWGLMDIQNLSKGLAAWDNGEYDLAARRFNQITEVCPRLPHHPGAGFDVLRLSDLSPQSVASFFLHDFGLDGDDSND